jgi:predicted Na+-dependent transporter
MLAMGLSLTVKQIMDPLRNTRLVLLALLANFILVPALAYLITVVIRLDDGEIWDPTPVSAKVLPGVLPVLTTPEKQKT